MLPAVRGMAPYLACAADVGRPHERLPQLQSTRIPLRTNRYCKGDIPSHHVDAITGCIGVIMSFAWKLACSKRQFTMSDTYHAGGAHSGSGRDNLQQCMIMFHCSDLATSSVACATCPRQASAATSITTK
jgi:hypothetical protein